MRLLLECGGLLESFQFGELKATLDYISVYAITIVSSKLLLIQIFLKEKSFKRVIFVALE